MSNFDREVPLRKARSRGILRRVGLAPILGNDQVQNLGPASGAGGPSPDEAGALDHAHRVLLHLKRVLLHVMRRFLRMGKTGPLQKSAYFVHNKVLSK